jgi:hypothetical protein
MAASAQGVTTPEEKNPLNVPVSGKIPFDSGDYAACYAGLQPLN